ncbi:hypothetical protein AGMMS50225_20570 [Betaproteobacteria bacterium]|nr:hypothetical protein AGMMS50225_20570 [Betaproteobacteria bacterium]
MKDLLKSLLSFDTLVTPKIITVIYYLGLAFALIIGLVMLVAGLFGGLLTIFLMGLAIIVFGTLGVRVYCELLILFFQINEALQDIRNK